MKAKATAAISEAVDLILWQYWDPIGVNDNPVARDEYSSYVPKVVRLLQDGADALKLAQHLHSLGRANMGIESYSDHCSSVAQRLLDEYANFA